MNTCIRETCSRKAKSGRNRGYCHQHYEALPVRGYVPSDNARERLSLLRSFGVTLDMIAESGLSKFGVICIETKPRIRALTEQKLMAIPVPSGLVSSLADVDALGTRRRIQGLVALGWPQALIAAELHTKQTAVSAFTRREKVTASTAKAVRELYERWSMTLGPSPVSARRARAAGWLPPLAWDDPDDPLEVPHTSLGGRVDFMDLYRDMQYIGLSQEQMVKKLGCTPSAFARRLHRYGIAVEASLQSLAWAQREGKAA
jgi:hypothetical protein